MGNIPKAVLWALVKKRTIGLNLPEASGKARSLLARQPAEVNTVVNDIRVTEEVDSGEVPLGGTCPLIPPNVH
jgi:hypothetical protein